MNLNNKSTIKELLKKYNARPEKYLGQHFILSKKALNLMIPAAEIKKTDTIIEIGPGLGTLTRELAATGAKVIAVEKDPLMIKILKETLANYKNIKIIQSDARKILPNLPDIRCRVKGGKVVDKYKYNYKKYKIVANLPYNVATFLIRQWLDVHPSPRSAGLRRARPDLMVLMIQKEVAQRMSAKPPHMNLLAVSTQFFATTEIIDYVSAEAFWPKPKVDAAIIKIVPKKKLPQKTRFAFFVVVKAGFSQPRKQLLNNLTKRLNIPREKLLSMFKSLKISEKARAENLSLEQWQKLALNLSTSK